MARRKGFKWVYSTKRWKTLRRWVFERDRWRCVKCGAAGSLECDHVVPMAAGGKLFDAGNLRTLCRGCHVGRQRVTVRRRPGWADLLKEVADAGV